ncbi:hypothetical protein [Halovenus sp. HT40]|uniref:hypothetical protein n=1 Tax=Halovenus sp. HT40 TaxID=3126691 RepID=UPI00300EDDC4
MERLDWRIGDLFYAGFLFAGLLIAYGATGYRLVMAGFVLTIGLVDWVESRQREASQTLPLLAITAIVHAVLLACLALPESRMAAYFGGLSAVFFLQAIRDVLVYEPNPIALFRHGYPSLVGMSIVCSALADGLVQFRRTLIVLLGVAFLFRKLYVRW